MIFHHLLLLLLLFSVELISMSKHTVYIHDINETIHITFFFHIKSTQAHHVYINGKL